MKAACDAETVLTERLRRQFLTAPIKNSTGYVEAFRRLQPVSPIHFSCPGDPPVLNDRAKFDDASVADLLRGKRTIVKGRFLGGGIGYVLAEDLGLYANTFCSPLSKPNPIQRAVFDAVRCAGPLTPRQVKDETGLLNKQIMPALHRLQRAFLVYEDQLDRDWERAWYDFGSEWPDVVVNDELFAPNAAIVLERFFSAHAFATFEQVKDWSQLSSKQLGVVLHDLETSHRIVPCEVPSLGKGWMLASDVNLEMGPGKPTVFMLHKADYLARSHASELKRRFGNEETLQYLLIDGKFDGAVVGHWRIGPHDVADIVLTLPASECAKRRKEIIDAVNKVYHAPHSHILKYNGKDIR